MFQLISYSPSGLFITVVLITIISALSIYLEIGKWKIVTTFITISLFLLAQLLFFIGVDISDGIEMLISREQLNLLWFSLIFLTIVYFSFRVLQIAKIKKR